LLKKHLRTGGKSEYYLGSKEFNPQLIEPIRKGKQKHNSMHLDDIITNKEEEFVSNKLRTIV
jgi:hypothetical protein